MTDQLQPKAESAEVCRILAEHGFTEARRRGSHIAMQKIGTVTGTDRRSNPPEGVAIPSFNAFPELIAAAAARSSGADQAVALERSQEVEHGAARHA